MLQCVLWCSRITAVRVLIASLQIGFYSCLNIWELVLTPLPSFLFHNHHGRKGLNKKSQLFHPPYQKSFSFSPPTKTGGRKHLFSVDTWPVSVQHISVACLCCVFLFLLFVQLHAEFVVLSEGKYCIMFLIILPRLKHKNIPAHQFICVYIPTNACRCWSCHYKNYLLKYFTKKCSE